MKDYSECVAYLVSLGLSKKVSEKICNYYKKKDDMKGLVDYILLCEVMVDSCVD